MILCSNLSIVLFYTDNSSSFDVLRRSCTFSRNFDSFFCKFYIYITLSFFLQKTSYLHPKLVTNYLCNYISSAVSKNVS